MTEPLKQSTDDFERILEGSGEEKYVLRLYVTGLTPRSTDAISRIKSICEEHLKGRYELDVIDIYQESLSSITDEQIVATPTLIKKLPLPLRRLVGDLSNKDRVLIGLDLQEA